MPDLVSGSMGAISLGIGIKLAKNGPQTVQIVDKNKLAPNLGTRFGHKFLTLAFCLAALAFFIKAIQEESSTDMILTWAIQSLYVALAGIGLGTAVDLVQKIRQPEEKPPRNLAPNENRDRRHENRNRRRRPEANPLQVVDDSKSSCNDKVPTTSRLRVGAPN